MSNSLAQVCALLIEDTYGELYSHIFSALVSCGRLSTKELAQKCHLPTRHVCHGLAVLIQAHFVYHTKDHKGRTQFEHSVRDSYHILRHGKYVEAFTIRYGPTAAIIVSQLLDVGQVRLGQLRHLVTQKIQTKTDDGANALPAEEYLKADQRLKYEETIRTLCQHRLVGRVRQAHFRSWPDNLDSAEKETDVIFDTDLKGSQKKAARKLTFKGQLHRLQDTRISMIQPYHQGRVGTKRKLDDERDDRQAKKAKVVKSVISQPDTARYSSLPCDHGSSFSDDLLVSINHARLVALFRSIRLVAMVTDVYGKRVARTYQAILQQLEADLPGREWVDQEPSEDDLSTKQSANIDENRLAQDLYYQGKDNGEMLGLNGYVNGNTRPLPPDARSHMEILCQEPYKFLSASQSDPTKYVIEPRGLCALLRQTEVFRQASARFDKFSVRILRMLLDKGKLDEKNLQEILLIGGKELRQALASLQEASFIELQEVPREAQRQPQRTIYLWFFDPEKARMSLIENTYISMARCLQRIKAERLKVKSTIDKSERTDVQGREEDLMSSDELGVLKGWQKKEAWLLAEVARLDDTIMVLRDF